MWLKLTLCFLVTCAWASHNPGWRHHYEYVYEVRGHILTSLNQISNNYTGIFLRSTLTIRPTSNGDLKAQISNAQYANINTKLHDHWKLQVPESQLDYQDIALSSTPFDVLMDNGVVRGIVVDKSISNWESNIIKGLVSQLQLDTEAKNQIRSSIDLLAQEGSNTAVFKTMEKTVTGEAETLYEIHPFPEYVLQTSPWLAPLKKLKENEEFIEVVKTKNFTHSKQRPSYHFGFHEVEDFDINNKIGQFLSRTSVSRAVLSGNLDSFTIQSLVTEDEVTVSPNLQDKQRGSSRSMVNLTLSSMEKLEAEFGEIPDPVNVGLVYSYNDPFDESNEPQQRFSSNTLRSAINNYKNINEKLSSSESGASADFEENFRVQEKPHIHEAPASPLLPFTVGFDGQAISKKRNIKEQVRNLAIQIGKELQSPENIPKENTVGKFLTLSSLVRVMNVEEMRYVSSQLYQQGQDVSRTFAWVAYRDAVAQAGTGPALLSIEEWIRRKQISKSEAAQVVATAASSARQPTEKYIQNFFGMVQNSQFMEEKHLNESLILSFTTLVHQVYVDEDDEHNKYPVHSFGSFNTEEGRQFIEKKVIPYLSSKLEEAISSADTNCIHVYIRALGNVGHQHILSAFKPYLEGTKKASQFQRVLMVVALDNLVKSNAKAARSVLFKIYQNRRDYDQVRVAAVYQLMRSNPSPSILQRMAHYTKIDTSNHVNSAVKSIIESAANLEETRFSKLREAAQSAKHLLATKEYGVQNSQIYMSNYVVEQMHLEAKQTVETLISEDSALPREIHYKLRGRLGGFKQQVVNLQAMVSSVEDLVNVFEQQTKSYRQLIKEKKSYESVNTKWSSEYTAKLLNMQNEQREQLEGYMYLHLDALQKSWSFDNRTIENITEVVKELEEQLRVGKHFNYTKMAIYPETVVSFPNEWGVPFIYTYDKPMLIHFESDVSATAKPSLYSSEGIQKPDLVDVDYELHGFISGRVQSQFGVFLPFNHKRYSAGYDKNFQFILPRITGQIHVDIENKQTKIEVQNFAKKSNNLLHFSTWPYTTQHDIYVPKPVTEVIRKANPQRISTILGEKHTGIAFSLEITSDETLDYGFFYDNFHDKNLVSALLAPWLNENIQHVQFDLGVDASKSTVDNAVFYLSHQNKYFSDSSNSFFKDMRIETISKIDPVFRESLKRQRKFLQNVTDGISNGHAQVVDAAAFFKGQRDIKYAATFVRAISNVDEKGRIILEIEKDNQQSNPVKISFTVDSKVPNPPSLNVNSALEFDPSTTIEVKGKIEEQSRSPSHIEAKIKWSKSEERKEYLTQQPQYHTCQKQMAEGNNQLPSCAMLTEQANLLDHFSIKVNYDNIDSYLVNQTYKLYSVLRHHLYPRLSENIVDAPKPEKNSLDIRGQYSPDLSTVNVSICYENLTARITNLHTNAFYRSILVPHPVYSIKQRLEAYLFSYDTYQPMCVVDNSAVNTLDNKTYPVILDKEWVVLLHYVPRGPSPIKGHSDLTVTQQLDQHVEGYITYARSYGQSKSQKEVKIVIQSPNTMGRVIDVTLKPSDSPSDYPKLYIQNEQIMYGDQGSHIYDNYMIVYKLPNGEITLEVYDAFYVVFDGERVKFGDVSDKFRDATRGLCGTFTGEPETDFTHPGNCIIHSPEVFVTTNTVPEKQRTKRMNDMMMIQAEEKKCYQKTISYVPVVSVQDSGLTRSLHTPTSNENVRGRTKYAVVDGQTCFSIDPLPACKSSYKEHSISRVVPVHCVASSRVAESLKKQIDQGANPSFKNKSPNRRILMTMAQRCEP